MSLPVSEFAQYLQLLDAAFSAPDLNADVGEAAKRDHLIYVQQNDLSLEQATSLLRDKGRIQKHIAVAQEALYPAKGVEPGAPGSVALSDLYAENVQDIREIKNAVDHFVTVGEKIDRSLTDLQEIAGKTHQGTENGEKLLKEIRAAAGGLIKRVAAASKTTTKIVERLEDVSTRVETEIKELKVVSEKIQKVDQQTSPEETAKADRKNLRLSVLWGTVASTALGTVATLIINHFSVPEKAPQPAPIIIVVPAPSLSPFPFAEEGKKGFVLKDVTTGKEYRFSEVTEKKKVVKKAKKPAQHKRNAAKVARHP